MSHRHGLEVWGAGEHGVLSITGVPSIASMGVAQTQLVPRDLLGEQADPATCNFGASATMAPRLAVLRGASSDALSIGNVQPPTPESVCPLDLLRLE